MKLCFHKVYQCSQQLYDFNVMLGLFYFQVAPVVLPMTTATTATVTATTTLLLHIQTMRWQALRYTALHHWPAVHTHTLVWWLWVVSCVGLYLGYDIHMGQKVVSFGVQNNRKTSTNPSSTNIANWKTILSLWPVIHISVTHSSFPHTLSSYSLFSLQEHNIFMNIVRLWNEVLSGSTI